MKDGHIRPLPSTNNITAPNTETRLFDANKTKFVPKIMLPMMTSFSSENFFNALRKIGPWTTPPIVIYFDFEETLTDNSSVLYSKNVL